MAGKPKGEIMTQADMIEAEQKKRSSRIYKAESLAVTDEAISNIVNKGLAQLNLSDNMEKINLFDADMVKEVSKQYLKACADSATLPSMAGLARALGCSRCILYRWMKQRHDTETGQWLLICHDLFSDVLAETALRNNSNPVVSIFLLKALFGLQDNNVIDVSQATEYEDDELGYDQSYKERYRKLIKGEH